MSKPSLLACLIAAIVPAVLLAAVAPLAAREPVRAPASDAHFKEVQSYVELDPMPGYDHASEADYEAFRDWKYGVRVHWGIYSIDGKGSESWPFLKLSNEGKQRYQQLYKTWNPRGFDADEWMKFFDRCGFRLMAFTAKHHDGFSMFDTAARVRERVNWTAPGGPRIEACDTAYSIMQTPFHRDVVKELCGAAERHGIKIDLYFSHPDWYDADFRDICQSPAATLGKASAAERRRMMDRHRAQLKQLLSDYGKIDTMCLDMWMDKAAWPTLRETMLELRRVQPDVMFRNRGIGNYGDYYTPEGFVPGAKENTDMPWMVIYPLGQSFSYMKKDHFKGTAWIVKNLVDTVAKGGNFMPGIGPDADGRFDPEAIRELEAAGKWLQVNGEAIYGTRPRPGALWKQGDNLRFTRSKDEKTVYAICLKWPGRVLQIDATLPGQCSKITMLGVEKPLTWAYDKATGLTIQIPEELQDAKHRPCDFAWAVKIKLSTGAAAVDKSAALDLRLRSRVESPKGSADFVPVETSEQWDAKKTAVVICDMWDRHWCKSASARVAEMAPRMNRVISKLRERGVLIVHAPGETMKYYAGWPGRKAVQAAPYAPRLASHGLHIPGPYPIDDSDGGCPDDPPCTLGQPWTREIAALEIKPGDGIGDDGDKIYNFLREHDRENVIVMGVHTNMCVLNRPYGIKALVDKGLKVALMRDLTDTMYNPRMSPQVDHFTGTDLVVAYIESYWCPTLTSDQILGGAPFRFAADKRLR